MSIAQQRPVQRLQRTIRISAPVAAIVFAAAYVPAIVVGYALKQVPGESTITWPAAGVLFLSLYLTSVRQWPMLLGLAFVSEICASYLYTGEVDLAHSILFPAANGLAALCGALFVKRLAKDPRTPRVSQVAAFFLGSSIGAAAGACLGALGAVHISAGDGYLHQLHLWWAGSWLGSLAIAPVGLTWVVRFFAPERALQKANPLELIGIAVVVLGTTGWGFCTSEVATAFILNIPYTVMILMIVATFRLPPRWATTLMAATVLVAATCAADGRGPFALGSSTLQGVAALQMFLSILAMCTFMLSTVLLEKRRLLLTLRRNEQRYQSFVRHSSEAIWRIELREPIPLDIPVAAQIAWLRTHGYIGECNASFQSLQSRIAPSDMAGDYWTAGIPWIDALLQNFETAAAHGYVVENIKFSTPHAAGHEDWSANFHGEIEDGRLLRIWGVASNQTELIRVNDALRVERRKLDETSRMLTDLVNASPLAVIVVDSHLRVRLWSGAAESLFGWSSQEVEGEILPIVPELERAAARPLRGDRQDGVEKRRLRKDGTMIFVHLWTTPLRDSNGDVIGQLAMLADVTEQKKLENQARQAQKLEALGTLAGGIAHDFNNILTLILGHLSLVRMDPGVASKFAAELDGIESAAQRGANLVRQILLFGRPQEQILEPLDLGTVVSEGAALLRSTLARSIDVACEIEDGLPRVAADSAKIQQIVINLGINASQAMKDNRGSIRLSLHHVEMDGSPQLGSPALPAGHYVRLIVSDDGSGMEPATVERIFDPFFTTKPAGKGSGLGLSVVRGIVLSHGGAISVYSKPGKGTAFSIFFPVATQPCNPQVPRVVDASSGGGKHVLYVDDEPGLVKLATTLLSRDGYRVTAFTDPTIAIDTFAASPGMFDVVVTDLSMPGTSGIELLRRVLAVRADIPVVITTGYISEQDRAHAMAAGCRAVITKPASLTELRAALSGVNRT